MAKPKSNIRVELKGRGVVTLRQSNYQASGGEGSIYRVGDTIVKLYNEAGKMRKNNLVEKIRFLSAIQHKYIVSPRNVVVDALSGEPLGFFMAYVDGEPFSRVFTNDFRRREGFGDEDAKVLVARMLEIVKFAHGNGAVLGDANELNWLAVLSTRDKVEPRIIDVDSWGIGHWPVTAIMPSIRDWHAKGFSRETDWFSWGVVTFQLFSGIHPYKGTLNGFGRGDLEGRMKANKSVFALGVRLNQAVRDFSCIPSALLDWYRSVFEHGERTAPPFPFDRVGVVAQVRVMRATTTGSGVLIFNKLFGKSGDPIIRVWPSGVVLLSSGALIDLSSKRLIGSLKSSKGEVIKAEGGWLIADWENGNPEYTFVSIAGKDGVKLSLPMTGWCFMRHQDRLFLVTDRGLTEIICKFIGRPLLAVGQTWGVMVNATSWFDGVGVQDAMGAMFVVVPFGANSCTSIRVPELDNVKTVFAKAGNRFVAIVVIDKKGNYKKLELTFDSDYKAYKIWQGDVDDSSLNVTMLPRGVCATIANDGELDIFVPRNAQLNRVKDKYISTDMMLANWEERVVYIQGGEVWEMRMK